MTDEQLNKRFDDLNKRFDDLAEKVSEQVASSEGRLVEKMRDMQTELLRGFEAFASGQTIRLRKVEADQSNLNTAAGGRLDVVESRLLQIELRLGLQQPNKPTQQ
jgi:hypothetical protein